MTGTDEKWITVQIRDELWINLGMNLVCCFDRSYSGCLLFHLL